MSNLKLQYLLSYGINGCIVPFIPLYLRQLQLTDTQVSRVMAVSGFAVLLSPIIVTLLADARFDARRIVAVLLLAAAAGLFIIPALSGFLAILLGFLLLNIVLVPIYPLQDGICLATQEQQLRQGQPVTGYHKVRVWGTIGFLVPGLLLYALVGQRHDVTVILYIAAIFGLLAAASALLLKPLSRAAPVLERKLPTAEAFRVLFGRRMLVFCLASFLLQMAAASYYTFYPIYLSEKVGLPRQWTGMIMNIGVVLEIGSMLAFGRILRALGPRRFLLLGCLLMAIRMALLALFPIPAVAIGIQLFHGMMVLLLGVGPVVLINRLAEDRFRNSLQGLYAMVVIGGGRIVGNLVVGPIAHRGYPLAFAWSTALILTAFALLLVAYHPAPLHESSAP